MEELVLVPNGQTTTKARKAKTDGKTLEAVIPAAFATEVDLEDGDDLEWHIEFRRGLKVLEASVRKNHHMETARDVDETLGLG
jgi:antitoxin component of MazEF toxin-antitoxin module